MKIIPIAIEKDTPFAYKFIEWKIHNVCTYNCSFCGSQHKDGSQRWFSLDRYKEIADRIIDQCGDKPFWIQFTAGEPTLYPGLLDLMKYLKSKGALISIITNGTRTLRWWTEVRDAKVLDFIMFTYHSEQTTDYKHIKEISNLFLDEPIQTVCLITHVIETLDLALEAFHYLYKNTGSTVAIKAMVIRDYDIYKLYTKEQLSIVKALNGKMGALKNIKAKSNLPEELKINHRLKIIDSDNKIHISDPQILLKNKQTNFYGWECDIGIDTMKIEYDSFQRGVCGVGGSKKIDEHELEFMTTPVICNVTECFCGVDIVANKRKV